MAGIDFIQDLAVVLVLAGLVGWLCHRIRLSVVVGYLLAGMLVGPHTPVRFVTDENRIQTLAQFGLVFLMFSIGLRLSLRKLRRLGPSLVFATAIGSLIMFYFARLAGAAMGWGGTESLFLAGMVMVSSSAVVTKVLQETDAMHEKAGQLAMGVSVLEDVVGVIMLTMLGWLTQLDGGGSGSTLWLLGAFVAVAGVGALLLVPWFLRRLSISAGEELQTLLTAGLLLGMAILAQKAGYSLALGAYLLGAVVAETPHRSQVERTFEGMRDVFSAVFFVAVGMLIDLHELVGAWPYILGISVLTIVGRAFASATGMVAIGTHGREALQVGLSVTPIGEFSFIIAQLGVTAGVIPARFYPIAVGVSLITTLVAPILVRRTDSLSEALAERRPR
ncbi:MAG TPA: cation:proton antiporter, partial [Opitutaceae bacterium]|nr:cation:proton antiporter [Opitutaceae bacterium]